MCGKETKGLYCEEMIPRVSGVRNRDTELMIRRLLRGSLNSGEMFLDIVVLTA